MRIRSIPRESVLHAKRAIHWQSNGAPFLSGDLFADNADVSVYQPKFRGWPKSRSQVEQAQVLFCPSHHLEELLEEYKGSINAKVLILGNSDRDFQNFDWKLPKNIRRVFLQNAFFANKMFRPIPIGIENLRLATNGMRSLFDSKYTARSKKDEILIGPFGKNHQERDFVDDISNEMTGYWEVTSTRLRPRQYAELSSRYRFIASPRGNGMDTHRFWETLYRGSFPIIKQSLWSTALSMHQIPMIEIADWSQDALRQVIKNNRERKLNPISVPALWWPYWESEIRDAL